MAQRVRLLLAVLDVHDAVVMPHFDVEQFADADEIAELAIAVVNSTLVIT